MPLPRPLVFPFLPVLLVSLFLAATCPAQAQSSGLPEKPRLVVLVSIDQFRADYLSRFEDLFLPPTGSGRRVGGFRWLLERGAQFVDAHHDHLPLATGPGHSVLFTGAPPYKSGIVGNDWYDRARKANVYCVQDEDSPLVGATGTGVSARNLRVTTVGDELKMATGRIGKVFGIALKDRASVLMAGHLADGVFWFDDTSGRWITSRAYRRDGCLPAWLEALNAEEIPRGFFGKSWERSVPDAALARLFVPPLRNAARYAGNPYGMGTRFPHPLTGGLSTPGRNFFRAFTYTPFANQFVLDSALRLAQAEHLGQDETPDILAINLSSNDYIGHYFGPDSAEVLDVTVQTDRQLAGFFNALDRLVPGGLSRVTVVITADHGGVPNAQAMREAGLPGGTWNEADAAKVAEAYLDKTLGEDKWVVGYIEPCLWLDHDTLARRGIARERAESLAATALQENMAGIYAAYPRHQILAGALPPTDIARHVTLGFHPQISGDVVLVSAPFWTAAYENARASDGSPRGTSHAEPYAYDTRVPLLLAGFGIRSGLYTGRVSTLDIAPTLSFLLRVQQPGGNEGRLLTPALAADGPRR